MDQYEQLEKLAGLKEKGIISDEEFSLQKAKLLNDNFSVGHQSQAGFRQHASPESQSNGTLWLPIPSLILGLISFFALFDDSSWDEDQIAGLILFSGLAITLGAVSLAKQSIGKGMSISGVVLGSIGLLAAIGMLN